MKCITKLFSLIVLSMMGMQSAAEETLTETAALAHHEGGDDSRVLGAYFGDSVLPQTANLLCAPQPAGEGFGGMPIVFSAQIDEYSLDPADFRVKVSGQSGWVTPICATLRPAVDPSELRTVLLVGEFGQGGANRPVAIRVVGDVLTTDGEALQGLFTRRVSATDVGPELLRAERVAPGESDCPADTTAVVKLTFSGGPTGPNGAPLDTDNTAIEAIQVVGIAGGQRTVLSPFALGDLDNDNHIDACLGPVVDSLTLRRVAVDSQVFFGPQNGPNRAAAVPIE